MPKLNDFKTQRRNANQHTERGLTMLDKSLDDGFIGAITTAADGETFDGSARLEVLKNKFGKDVEPIIIESDGTRPIIHRRIDIPNASDPRAVKLAIAANRVAEVDLDWDVELLTELDAEGDIDLSDFFTDNELFELAQDAAEGDRAEADDSEYGEDDRIEGAGNDGDRYALAIVLGFAEYQEWKIIKESLGEKKDTKAFLKLMRGDVL